MCPAVAQLKDFFDFSAVLGKSNTHFVLSLNIPFSNTNVLEDCFSRLLRQLCKGSVADTKTNLEKLQAIANLLAQTLTFALDFDDLKMTNPSIQNDFSYYRRTLSRLKMTPENKVFLDSAVVKDELANRMSLFYAYPTPMLKTLVDGLSTITSNSTSDKLPSENVTLCLSLMVSVCHVAVMQNKYVLFLFPFNSMISCSL